MEKHYLDLSLQEFLDAITNKELEYSFVFEDDEDPTGVSELVGTKKQIIEFLDNYIKENGTSDSIKDLYRKIYTKEKFSYRELQEIEIYNYLERLTSNFDPEKVRILSFEIDVYYSMDFSERTYEESRSIYKKEGWEIPGEVKYSPITGENVFFADYRKMFLKTHYSAYVNIKEVQELLQGKMMNSKNAPFNHKWDYKQIATIAKKLKGLGKIDKEDDFVKVMQGRQGCIDWETTKTDLKIFLSYFCKQIQYSNTGIPEVIPNSKFPQKEAELLFTVKGERLTKGTFSISNNNEYDALFSTI